MKKNTETDEFIDFIVNECLIEFRNEREDEYQIIYELVNLFRKCEEEFIGLENTRENKFYSRNERIKKRNLLIDK